MPTGKLTGALAWRSVGPYSGGRVTTVAGIADKPNVFYMGTAGGGLWQTGDYGQTWRNISDKDFKSNNIGAMAIAPSNPKIIYVGTGDSAPRNTVLTGEGMYKSTDGGRKWTYIGLGETHIISWILVRRQTTRMWFTWRRSAIHLFGPNPGSRRIQDHGWRQDSGRRFCTSIRRPARSAWRWIRPIRQVVYAAMWQMSRRHWTFSSGGPGSGIYQTTDGGTTWANISHRPGLHAAGIFGRVGIAVAPSQPGTVYALIQADYKGQAGGLFRSDKAGQSWKLINNSMDITQRAFYYMTVFVDPARTRTRRSTCPTSESYVSHNGGKKLIEAASAAWRQPCALDQSEQPADSS